jgi:hypothetical protein
MQALVLHPNAVGMLFAAAAIAVGAPVFSEGLRALRLRRRFRGLRHSGLSGCASGLTHVSGRVSLESPLFAPLSGRPCAGFRLEVSSPAQPVPRRIEMFRPFRITDGDVSARVMGPMGRWDLMVTSSRDVAAAEPLSEFVSSLLAGAPEARWLRDSGQSIRLVEHALLAGTPCHVVGFARQARRVRLEAEAAFERSGTDDAALAISGAAEIAQATGAEAAYVIAEGEPDLWLGAGDQLDFLLISDAPPQSRRLSVSPLRLAGLALGPALSLAGMLYLAAAAQALLDRGGF